MKKIAHFLAFILFVVLICIVSPIAFAVIETSGQCGDNITWTLQNKVLTLTGSGPMYDYGELPLQDPGWKEPDELDAVSKIIIGDGITHIGNQAFSHLTVSSINIPSSVTSIGDYAFSVCRYITEIVLPENLTEFVRDSHSEQGKRNRIRRFCRLLKFREMHYFRRYNPCWR